MICDAGTAFMAVCETEIMVGSIIIAKTNITASKLCPFGKFKIDWIFGTIKANLNNPYNTDGIPDIIQRPVILFFALVLVQFLLKRLL